MTLRASILTLAVMSGPAFSGTFLPPKGCTAYLTVQASNCIVEHHWTCADDAKGEKWHAELNQNGPVYLGKIGDQAEWLISYFADTQERETLMTPVDDSVSLDVLFAEGLDTYKFTMNTQGGPRVVTGFDRIAERNIKIDGEVLHRTEYDIEIRDQQGAVTYASVGSEYVSEKHRRFFSGYGAVTAPETPYDYKASPVEFIYPGEQGYLDTTPKYGCDVVSARAMYQQKDPSQ